MNLINDPWLAILDKNGSIKKISVKEIINPDYESIYNGRFDFRGAIYQFLIGLLQTVFRPITLEDWLKYWHSPPSLPEIENKLDIYSHAFHIINAYGPAFMQDYDLDTNTEDDEEVQDTRQIFKLFIDSPGENTIRKNCDLFVKRDRIQNVCLTCAALALFTLQINAPSGGQGHRTGLRGGGPLTTLLEPSTTTRITLWKRLWLNVIPENEEPDIFFKTENTALHYIFPWLASTRISDEEQGTSSDNAHPLQVYWAMPRRIRLVTNHLSGLCDLCGDESRIMASSFITKNYGIKYTGNWKHPLTPYRINKKTSQTFSIKGQTNNIGYRSWMGLILGDEQDDILPAAVIKSYKKKALLLKEQDFNINLWCFGYDMDKMKALAWDESLLPIFTFQKDITEDIKKILQVSINLVIILKKSIFSIILMENIQVEKQFWNQSEPIFYKILQEFILDKKERIDLFKIWSMSVTKLVLSLFDDIILTAFNSNYNKISEIFNSRKYLFKQCKSIQHKLLKGLGQTDLEKLTNEVV